MARHTVWKLNESQCDVGKRLQEPLRGRSRRGLLGFSFGQNTLQRYPLLLRARTDFYSDSDLPGSIGQAPHLILASLRVPGRTLHPKDGSTWPVSHLVVDATLSQAYEMNDGRTRCDDWRTPCSTRQQSPPVSRVLWPDDCHTGVDMELSCVNCGSTAVQSIWKLASLMTSACRDDN
jgi:hypothetical protein